MNFGSNGITSRFGNGGIDIGGNLYKLAKRLSDKASLQNYKATHSQSQGDAAYWAYVYGDWTQETTAARIANGKDELNIVEKMAGNATAQTVQNASGNGRVITMKDSGDVLVNAVQLGHEAYRDGVVGNKAEQLSETIQAVLAHSAMADRMTQYNNTLTGSLALEAALSHAGRTDILAALAGGMYDSSADYWKLVKNTDDRYGWQEDGQLDFYLEDGSKIDADYFASALNGSNYITSPENIKATNKLIQNLKDSGYSKEEIKEFLNGTAGFADASVAARNLMSGKLSQSELDAMNKGLYAAQESGLLVKNSVLNPEAGLIGSGTSDNPYFSLNTLENETIKISGKAGYRIVDLEMYEKVGKNGQNPTYPLYEFALVNHNGYDGVGGGAIVANENGSLSLTYDKVNGIRTNLQGAFDSYQVSHGSTDTIMNYFTQFGSSGTSMSYANGIYSLNGVTAGTQIGTMGSTGYATNVHAHMTVNGSGEQFGKVFEKILLNTIITKIDPYARYMTGYKYNNFYDNDGIWNNLYQYSTQSNYLNYQTIQTQHYLEYEYYSHLHKFSKPIIRK